MEGRQAKLAFILLWISTVSGEYLFTLPQVLKSGSGTSYCILLTDMDYEGFDPYQGFEVGIKFMLMNTHEDMTKKVTQTATFATAYHRGDFYQCQEIEVPDESGRYSAVVNATLTYTPTDQSSKVTVDIFGAEKEIKIKTPNFITLVQTDKPIYKPGQTVKFRVMTMDYKMMSLTDGYKQITIESPNGMRVMQWDDVPSPTGLVSLEMQLSSDPVMGTWTIKVVHGMRDIVQTFKVDEYVLPKFEVTVTPPKYLLPTSKQIAATVCAKYTYGKNVKGTMKVKVCYERRWYYSSSEMRPCAFRKIEIDGCKEFFIDAEEIMLGYRSYGSWGSLIIDANVTEEQTGIELTGSSQGPSLSMYPLNLKIEDDSENYFKSKFPYQGRVIVTNPDGSPAPGEHIRVKGYGNRDSVHVYTNNFTTDDNGIVNFAITEFDEDTGFMNVNADAIVYQSDWRYSDDELYIRTYTPSAYVRLTKWYSPSDSYIYLPELPTTPECDTNMNLDVLYTAKPMKGHDFIITVKAGDDIIFSKKHRVDQAMVDEDVNRRFLAFNDNEVLLKQIKPTPPPTSPLPPLPPLPEPEYYDEAEAEEVTEEIIVPEVIQPLGGEPSPRKKRSSCADWTTDTEFMNCFSSYTSLIGTVDQTDPMALPKTLCSKKGRVIIECFQNKIESCPEVLTSPKTKDVFASMTQLGDLDKLCAPFGSTNKETPSGNCAQNFQSDVKFMQCIAGYSTFMQSVAVEDQNSMMKAMCSDEGQAAIQCILDKLETCPELLTSPETSVMFNGINQMNAMGGFDTLCSILTTQAADTMITASFKIEIPITQQMAPSASVLVYYVREDKEIVASSLNFNIKNCFRNKVSMSFDETTVRPGHSVNLNIGASPRSNCFVGMVDKSVNLLGGNNQLTPAQLFERVSKESRPYHYVSYWNDDRDYCSTKMGPKGSSENYYAGYYSAEGVDAAQAFRDLYMWVETDAQLESRPCVEQRHYYYMPLRRRLPGMPGNQPVELQTSNEDKLIDYDSKENIDDSNNGEDAELPDVRTFFPETWLWDMVLLGSGGGGVPGDIDPGAPIAFASEIEQTAVKVDQSNPEPVQADTVRTFFPETWLWDIVILGYDGEGIQVASMFVDAVDNKAPLEPETIRSYFPETWLWNILSLGDEGSLTFETSIPDTITEWIGNTVCTHESDGVGVTDLVGVTAFQPFFVSLTLPYSAIRGEVLPVLATVFNYLTECITLRVTFRENEGFEFSDLSGNSREFCLCGGESESTKFHVIPVIIGEIDLEVTVVSTRNVDLCKNVVLGELSEGVSDGVQRQLLIEPEGVPRDQTKSSYVCVRDNEVITETVDLNLPDDTVPDSERATVSVVGDIMGPTLSNLKNLLRMPYGCGEQNMASWSPNIYVLQYLESTNQMTKETEDEAKGYMRVGYQRQMNYRHSDYSYSAWGETTYDGRKNNGSSWLTAFVVKSMAQSSAFIVVDNEDVVNSARWLAESQDENSGCFPRLGHTFSSYLKGGLDGDNEAGLTAFILIALLEADLGEEFDSNITLGFSACLGSVDIGTTDTYTLSVMLYAYSIYDIEGLRRADVMDELNNRKIEKDGLTHWQRAKEEEPMDDYMYWYRAPSAEVEMTAYILLSILAQENDIIGTAQPIIQWLTKQRNPYGGFSSTQDTVVALQALAEFGKRTYSGETAVSVEVMNRGVNHVFSVSPSNALVYQTTDVNPSQGALKITTSGTGCALVQVNLKYNVYTEENTGPAFDVKVSVFRSNANPNNCALRTLELCTSYVKGGVSNMAITEVKMPTGWTPVTSTIRELVSSNNIQKFEVDNNVVQLYFDEFSSSQKCVDFDVEQEIRMNPKAANVRVYDYYETGYTRTVNYTIRTTCGTKEEIPLDNEGLDCSIMQCREKVNPLESRRKTCPVCLDSADNEYIERLLCDAKIIYKAAVRRKGDYSIKLMADIRPKEKIVVDRFVNYDMDMKCACPEIDSGPESKAFIFTSSTDIFDGKVMNLEEQQKILAYSSKYEGMIRKLASRSKFCEKLSRLKRSKSSDSITRLLRLRQKLGVI